MSKRIKVFKLLVFIATFLCFSININGVSADYTAASIIGERDKQFQERVKILKQILGKKVNEVALAATVLSKETAFDAVGSRYKNDSNWQGDYKSSMSALFGGTNIGEVDSNNNKQASISSDTGVTTEQLDLLTAAAIIMADSSGLGSYNEKKYKEALARDTFTTNGVLNAIFCGTSGVANGIMNIGSTDYTIESGTSGDRTWYNRQKICENGYVGGIYDITAENTPDEELRKMKKEEKAQEIIDFIHYYCKLTGSEEVCATNTGCSAETTSGDFANWKQFQEEWGSKPVGNGGTMSSIGCLVTSIAIQIARSGTQLTNLSNGFDPGVFVDVLNNNGGFVGGGAYTWTGHESIAPNWKREKWEVPVNTSSTETLAKVLSEELSTGAEDGKYQRFIVLFTSSDKYSGHWVAVDSVSGNDVTIFDPAESGTTLDENYNSWTVNTYSVLYATDVEFGKTGSSTSSSLDSCGASSLDDLMEFINNFEGGTTCNDGTGYTTSTLPNDPGGLTASNGVTLGTARAYAEQAGVSDIDSEYYSGCPNKEKMDKIKKAILQSMYDEVGESANEKGVTLSEREHLALTSVRYGGYGMDRAILDQMRDFGNESYEVFHCFVSLGCGFGNGSYMDGLANRRAGEYELFRTGNTNVRNVGKGYAYYQAITNKAELEHYMQTDWPTGE